MLHAQRWGRASLVLYDVTRLYVETHEGDGLREPGFSKERRLEPQITLGLLTDATGFPLMLEAFEGNTAETKTMLPVITSLPTNLLMSRSSRTLGCPVASRIGRVHVGVGGVQLEA